MRHDLATQVVQRGRGEPVVLPRPAPLISPAQISLSPLQKRLNRAYGRVDRAALRHHLLSECAAHGVTYLPDRVVAVDTPPHGRVCTTTTSAGGSVVSPLITLAGGAVSAQFLDFEDSAPRVAAQTAYGVTAVVEGYEAAYDPEVMLFMDYRRTHSGMWDGTGAVLSRSQSTGEMTHPNWNASFGSCSEAPSFLYAMPLKDGKVFLEETCLVARPTLPFAVLKRRLKRRCAAMGIRIKEARLSFSLQHTMVCHDRTFLDESQQKAGKNPETCSFASSCTVGCLSCMLPLPRASLTSHSPTSRSSDGTSTVQIVDEEYSFIPVGGPMPLPDQPLTAFGAAANLVHPATGYSITRMLDESGPFADAITTVLKKGLPVQQTSHEVWDALWPMEKRRQVRRLVCFCSRTRLAGTFFVRVVL
jgi:hypothetical protein